MTEEAGSSKAATLIIEPEFSRDNFKLDNVNVNNIREVSPTSSSGDSVVSFLENVSNPPMLAHFPQFKETVFAGLTKRQLLILTALGLSEFFGAMVYSIHGPFFPKEASRKGVSALQFGFAFGAFELAVLICSPIFWKMMRKNSVTPNLLYHLGVFTLGIGAVIFSLLGLISDSTIFLAGSIIVRILEGIGEAAFITASYTLIADEFPDAVTSTFASLQTFFGLGIICGPIMGAELWDALYTDDLRFTLTFGVLGCILLFNGILGLFVLPQNGMYSHELAGRKSVRCVQIVALLKIGSVRLAAFSIVSAAVSVGFLSVILELHLRQFGLHPVLLGGIFVISAGIYSVSSPVYGWIIQKFAEPKYFILLGAFLIFDGFILIGPATFIPLETSVLLSCVGLCLQGLGLGAILVSAFNLTLRKAVEFGYATNITTYGIVSSLWISMFSFGSFLGSSAAGIFFDNFGFRSSIWIVIGMQALLILTTFISILSTKNNQSAVSRFKMLIEEDKPLLFTSSKSSTPAGVSLASKYGSARPTQD